MTNFVLFYTRQLTYNKQIATSKDTMKDCQLKEKFCDLKKKRFTYPNKIAK